MKRRDYGAIHKKRASAENAIDAWADQVHATEIIRMSPDVGIAEGSLYISLGYDNPGLPENPLPDSYKRLVTVLHSSTSHARSAMPAKLVQEISASLATIPCRVDRKTKASAKGTSKIRGVNSEGFLAWYGVQPSSGIGASTRSETSFICVIQGSKVGRISMLLPDSGGLKLPSLSAFTWLSLHGVFLGGGNAR